MHDLILSRVPTSPSAPGGWVCAAAHQGFFLPKYQNTVAEKTMMTAHRIHGTCDSCIDLSKRVYEIIRWKQFTTRIHNANAVLASRACGTLPSGNQGVTGSFYLKPGMGLEAGARFGGQTARSGEVHPARLQSARCLPKQDVIARTTLPADRFPKPRPCRATMKDRTGATDETAPPAPELATCRRPESKAGQDLSAGSSSRMNRQTGLPATTRQQPVANRLF